MAKKWRDRACKKCKRIFEPSVMICPYCGVKTTEFFSGFVGVVNAKDSAIAKTLGIEENGAYALKVR